MIPKEIRNKIGKNVYESLDREMRPHTPNSLQLLYDKNMMYVRVYHFDMPIYWRWERVQLGFRVIDTGRLKHELSFKTHLI